MLVGVDVLDVDLVVVDAFANEVETHLDVLAPVVENWVLAKQNYRFVVHKNGASVVSALEKIE